MKCPKCGKEMYLITNSSSDTSGNFEMKYVCPKCAYEIKNTLNDLVYREPLFQSNHSVTNYGWICPKCGAVLSPSTQECPYCTPYKLTCGQNSGSPIKTVPLGNNITSQAQVLHTPPTPPDNITVTGNCDLTSQPQAETMVSK